MLVLCHRMHGYMMSIKINLNDGSMKGTQGRYNRGSGGLSPPTLQVWWDLAPAQYGVFI